MKKSGQGRRTAQEVAPTGPAPDKVGWVRQFCGRGLFREIWKNRFLFLRGERLWVSTREVKDERGAQHVLEMSNFDRCEELKKEKSRSKKSHSRFTLVRRSHTPNTVHSLVFLALSPEEKESWIHALNTAISRTKTRTKDPILDQVALEDGALVHPTRERVRIPPGRRLPSRGHLLAVASSSQGCLTLDLVAEEDFSGKGSWERGMHDVGDVHVDCRVVGGRQRAGTDVSKLRPSSKETRVKTSSLPRASERNWGRGESSKALKNRSHIQVFKGQSRTPQPGKKLSSQGRNRCASMDEVLSSRPALIRSELRSALRRCPSEDQPPVGQLQSLIAQRMQRAQELLEEMRLQELQKTKNQRERTAHKNSPKTQSRPQNQSKSRSGGSGSPRVQTKDSPQTKAKKTKVKSGTDSAKPRDQAKFNHSPSLKHQAKSNQSPSLNDQTKSNQSPCRKDQTKSNQSPGLKNQILQSPLLKSQMDSSPGNHTQSESKNHKNSLSSPKPNQPDPPETSEIHSPTTTEPEVESDDKAEPEQTLESEPCDEILELHQNLEEVLEESDQDPDQDFDPDLDSDQGQGLEEQRAEAERLLQEALCSWRQAQEVLKEVRELQSQTLRRQRRKTYREQDQGLSQDHGLDQDQGLNQNQGLNQDHNQDQNPDQGADKDLSKSDSQTEGRTDSETRLSQAPAEAESGAWPEGSTTEGAALPKADS